MQPLASGGQQREQNPLYPSPQVLSMYVATYIPYGTIQTRVSRLLVAADVLQNILNDNKDIQHINLTGLCLERLL
jgi:hypothetical protein